MPLDAQDAKEVRIPFRRRPWQRYAFNLQHRSRFNVRLCHRAAGKSAGLADLCLRYALQHPHATVGYAVPEFRSGLRTWWKELRKLTMHLGDDLVYPNRQDMVWLLPQVNSSMHMVSLSDAEAQRGLHLDLLVIDEAQNLDTKIFERILYPMVHNSYLENPERGGLIWITGTARFDQNLLFSAWNWAGEKRPGWDRQRWSIYDTKLYTHEYIEEQLKPNMSDEAFIQEYECRFILSRNLLLFPSFSDDNIDNSVEVSDNQPILVGMDFNVTPMTCVLAIKTPDGLHIFNEIVLMNSRTEEMASEIVNRIDDPRRITVFPDQSGRSHRSSAPVGQTDLTILQDFGMRVFWLPSGNPSVLPSIRGVNQMLCDTTGKRRITIHNRCTNLLEGLRTMKYKEGTSSIPDKSNPYNHIVDAFRYLCTPFAPGMTTGVRQTGLVL